MLLKLRMCVRLSQADVRSQVRGKFVRETHTHKHTSQPKSGVGLPYCPEDISGLSQNVVEDSHQHQESLRIASCPGVTSTLSTDMVKYIPQPRDSSGLAPCLGGVSGLSEGGRGNLTPASSFTDFSFEELPLTSPLCSISELKESAGYSSESISKKRNQDVF